MCLAWSGSNQRVISVWGKFVNPLSSGGGLIAGLLKHSLIDAFTTLGAYHPTTQQATQSGEMKASYATQAALAYHECGVRK
ncbi:hypothetical protein Pmani_013730 [Petrolisthes manimaculis]|uniref:Uncharacterized protein n=1 Tax=Petrolisthes manimaculis TaxID=1843537 RepID=A0AAE1PVT9_9EUCA|nr:hypothetical protein Pmani_013730 [Petrolisthes manimaculis]